MGVSDIKRDHLNTNLRRFMTFTLADDTYGLPILKIREIISVIEITVIPRMPSFIKGVINLRGTVLPVADMRIKFGLPEIEVTKDTCILVLQITIDNEDVLLGALVDNVKEVLEIEETQIQPTPSIGTRYKAEFLKGMLTVDEDFIMLLNLDLIFSSEELLDETMKIAMDVASLAPQALAAAKEAMGDALDFRLDKGLKFEVDLFAELFSTQDQKEGLAAFLEKREPNFTGE